MKTETNSDVEYELSFHENQPNFEDTNKNELTEEENWKNKGKKTKEIRTNLKRRSKYINSCTDIRCVLNTSELRSTSLTFMLNGNHKPAVKVNKNKIIIFNTCAFDSLLAAISTGYIDCKLYKSYVDENMYNRNK